MNYYLCSRQLTRVKQNKDDNLTLFQVSNICNFANDRRNDIKGEKKRRSGDDERLAATTVRDPLQLVNLGWVGGNGCIQQSCPGRSSCTCRPFLNPESLFDIVKSIFLCLVAKPGRKQQCNGVYGVQRMHQLPPWLWHNNNKFYIRPSCQHCISYEEGVNWNNTLL